MIKVNQITCEGLFTIFINITSDKPILSGWVGYIGEDGHKVCFRIRKFGTLPKSKNPLHYVAYRIGPYSHMKNVHKQLLTGQAFMELWSLED